MDLPLKLEGRLYPFQQILQKGVEELQKLS